MKFSPLTTRPEKSIRKNLLFRYKDSDLFCQVQEHHCPQKFLPCVEKEPGPDWLYFGELNEFSCYCRMDHTPDPAAQAVNGRELLTLLDKPMLEAVLKGQVLAWWFQAYRFCGSCGSPLSRDFREWAMFCEKCTLRYYPKISPAVIVRITRGDQILLARNAASARPMFSNVAGFVDPGEDLETTLHREVAEEVGISVKNIRYFGSQVWTVTQSLIIAFTAEYADGEIKPDGVEIAEAGWFNRDSLPELPGKGSISRDMIDDFVQNDLTR